MEYGRFVQGGSRQEVGVCGARQRLNLDGHEPRLGSALNQLSIIPHGSGPMPDGVEGEPIGRVENLNWGPRAIEVSATEVPPALSTPPAPAFSMTRQTVEALACR